MHKNAWTDKIKVSQQKKENNDIDIDAVFEFLILLKLSFFCCFCHSFFRLNDKDTELPPLRKGDWYDWLWCWPSTRVYDYSSWHLGDRFFSSSPFIHGTAICRLCRIQVDGSNVWASIHSAPLRAACRRAPDHPRRTGRPGNERTAVEVTDMPSLARERCFILKAISFVPLDPFSR